MSLSRIVLPPIMLLLVAIAFAPTVRGDTLFRKQGGKIVGTVVEGESNLTTVTFKTKYGTLQIPRTDIDRIEVTEPEENKAYSEVVSNYGTAAKDRLALAIWCLDHKYLKEYRQHLAEVIEIDPDNEEARRRLGYRRHDGAWTTLEELRQSQGYVKHQGKYVLPQEKEETQLSEVRTQIQKDFIKKIKLWRNWLRSDRKEKRETALKELMDLRDAEAVSPLMALLGEDGSPAERYLLAEILENIEGDAATAGLLRIAFDDDVKDNRWRAIDSLGERKSPALVSTVTARLRDTENAKVRRAADLLGEIGDETVVPALVDALITTHRIVHEYTWEELIARNSGSSYRLPGATIRPDGVMIGPSIRSRSNMVYNEQMNRAGTSVGPQPTHEVKIEECKNVEVLGALTTLTGEDFGYDKKSWLSWVKVNHRKKAIKAGN